MGGVGPLMGVPNVAFKKWQCRTSLLLIFHNVTCRNVTCHNMSHVEFKKRLCPMSLYYYFPCRIALSPMSHVHFRGQGPFGWEPGGGSTSYLRGVHGGVERAGRVFAGPG